MSFVTEVRFTLLNFTYRYKGQLNKIEGKNLSQDVISNYTSLMDVSSTSLKSCSIVRIVEDSFSFTQIYKLRFYSDDCHTQYE